MSLNWSIQDKRLSRSLLLCAFTSLIILWNFKLPQVQTPLFLLFAHRLLQITQNFAVLNALTQAFASSMALSSSKPSSISLF